MAEGYISSIKLPDNKTYLLKDSEKTDKKVEQLGNTENKEFSILLKSTNNTTDETTSVKYGKASNKLVTINPSLGRITAPGGLAFNPTSSTYGSSGMPIYWNNGIPNVISYLNLHLENTGVILPFLMNDLVHLVRRGGTYEVYSTTATDYTPININKTAISVDMTNAFDGTLSYCSWNRPQNEVTVIDISCPDTFTYTTRFYIDFGLASWRAKKITVLARNEEADSAYVLKGQITNNALGYYFCSISHANDATGINRLRIVLSDYNGTLNRIAQIGVVNYGRANFRANFMSRGNDDGVWRSISPATTETYDLGTTSNYWNNVYATNFYGSGANLTSLDASNISSGTLSADRLDDSGVATGTYGTLGTTTTTLGYSGTFYVPFFTVDKAGRITYAGSKPYKLPASQNTATAADNILEGSNSGTQITYKPYTAKQSKLSLYTGTTAPNGTTRLNLNGYLYATKLYSNGTEVSVVGHTHDYLPVFYTDIDYTSASTTAGIYPHDSTNPVTNTREFGGLILFGSSSTSNDYYSAQLLVSSATGAASPVHAYIRRMTNTPAWSDWSTLLDDKNYKSYTVSSIAGKQGDVTLEDLGLSKAMRFIGVATKAITDGGTEDPTIEGYNTKTAGDVVIDKESSREYVWSTTNKWELLGGDSSYKIILTAVNSATAETTKATTFVHSVTLDENGVITVKTRPLDTSGTWSGTATTATNLSAKPSFAVSNTNNITLTIGDKTSDAFTVPYATSAGSLATEKTIWGQTFDGSANITGHFTMGNTSSRYHYFYIKLHGTNNTVADIMYDSGNATNVTSGRWRFSEYSPNSTANNNTTGYTEIYYLPTVTKGLTETVTYNILTTKDLSFSITGNANTATSAGKWTTACTLTIGNTGKSVDGSENVSWSLADIGAAASGHNHDSVYLKLNGSNNMTADVNIIAGDTDKFINFWYNANKTAGASWRIGELGSGTADKNYFVIQSGTSSTSGTDWNNTIRIGANTFDVYLPSTTASTSTTSGALTVEGGAGIKGQLTATRLAANGSNTSYNLYVNGNALFNIGTSDSVSDKRFLINGNNRALSIGGRGLHAYNIDGTEYSNGLLNLQYYGGNMLIGNSGTNQSVTGNVYGNFTYHNSIIFNNKNAIKHIEFTRQKSNNGPSYICYPESGELAIGYAIGYDYSLAVFDGNTALRPGKSDTFDLGASSYRWKTIYGSNKLSFKNSTVTRGASSTNNIYTSIEFIDKNDKPLALIDHISETNGRGKMEFVIVRPRTDTTNNYFGMRLFSEPATDGRNWATFNTDIIPYTSNNTYTLGDSTILWKATYSKSFIVDLQVTLQYNSTDDSLDFVFA